MQVADVPGVDVAGIMIDAGPRELAGPDAGRHAASGGPGKDRQGQRRRTNPTALQDVFFRIGGPHVGKATVGLEVNSDHVVLDDIWAWRADHGCPAASAGRSTPSDTGVVVNGDDVTATGLFFEHFQKDNVIWYGERGKTIFFQNELPYDPPTRRPGSTTASSGRRRTRSPTRSRPTSCGAAALHLHQRQPDAACHARVRGAGHAGRAGCTTC